MGHRGLFGLSAATLVAFPATVFAHVTAGRASTFEPWLVALLVATAFGYGLGRHEALAQSRMGTRHPEGERCTFRRRVDGARDGVVVSDRRNRGARVLRPHA